MTAWTAHNSVQMRRDAAREGGRACQEGAENLLTSDSSYRQAQGTPLLTFINFSTYFFLFFKHPAAREREIK